MSKRDLSPDSLEAQADALLAAADSMDIPDEIPMPGKSSRSGKAAKAARPEADHIMTDEEAKKAGIVRLDDKQVAALPAASWLMGQEKLRELLARGKKKGKLDSGELMEAVDDLNLESDQMDQLYDSLEALNIDIGTEEDLLPELSSCGRSLSTAWTPLSPSTACPRRTSRRSPRSCWASWSPPWVTRASPLPMMTAW